MQYSVSDDLKGNMAVSNKSLRQRRFIFPRQGLNHATLSTTHLKGEGYHKCFAREDGGDANIAENEFLGYDDSQYVVGINFIWFARMDGAANYILKCIPPLVLTFIMSRGTIPLQDVQLHIESDSFGSEIPKNINFHHNFLENGWSHCPDILHDK